MPVKKGVEPNAGLKNGTGQTNAAENPRRESFTERVTRRSNACPPGSGYGELFFK